MQRLDSFYLTGIQTAMVPIGYPGPVHVTGMRINLYTAPAFLSSLVGILNLVLLFTVFREHRVLDAEYNFNIQDKGRTIKHHF